MPSRRDFWLKGVGAFRLNPLAKGLLSCLPGVGRLAARRSGGSDSAGYCYSVWLRHLVLARRQGIITTPDTVAELGPGDSLGIGLSALLSGARRYWAFDRVASADLSRNLVILDDLLGYFTQRRAIPHEGPAFADVKPPLDSYDFPGDILDAGTLERALAPERVEAIRSRLRGLAAAGPDSPDLRYVAPWNTRTDLPPGSVDFVFSQAVLEHVDQLHETYQAMARWVKPGGAMSHQIDFRSHGTAKVWNGHWAYPDPLWRLIRGKRPYLINREPLSVHLEAMEQAGFEVVNVIRSRDRGGLPRTALAPRFRQLSEDDIQTAGALVQARRRF